MSVEVDLISVEQDSSELRVADTPDGIKKIVFKHLSRFGCTLKQNEKEPREASPSRSSISSDTSQDFRNQRTTYVHPSAPEPAACGSADKTKNDDVYDFSYKHRGLAVIINNEHFPMCDNFDSRPGSTEDAVALYRSLKALGFYVLWYNNLTAYQMMHVLENARKIFNHEDSDCFICSILTHGNQAWVENIKNDVKQVVRHDLLYGVDGEPCFTSLVVDTFSDARCPALAGKPRIFFLQACRGGKYDDGQSIIVTSPARKRYQNYLNAARSQARHSHADYVDMPARVDVELPVPAGSLDPADLQPQGESALMVRDKTDAYWSSISVQPVSPAPISQDFLIMYATPPGYYAWRRNDGSWFIQNLCKQLSQPTVEKESLLSILTRVSGMVANMEAYNKDDQEMCGKKEIPVIESKLLKDVILTRKPGFGQGKVTLV